MIEATKEGRMTHVAKQALYDGKIIYKNGNIQSSNVDKERHGVGLLSIRKSVEKYDGMMEIENTNELFKVVIILPL